MRRAYPGQPFHEKDGIGYAPDGTMIEDFGLAENLMVVGAIRKTGGDVCHSFEEAVTLAKQLADKKMRITTRLPQKEGGVQVSWGRHR